MSDLISRQEAIDALMAWEEDSVWDDECLKHRGEPYWVAPSDVIERLPSAQPDLSGYSDKLWKAAYERGKAEALAERKTGRWEYVDYRGFGNYHCSACRTICICNGDYDFCPNCGADMRGEQDEVD